MKNKLLKKLTSFLLATLMLVGILPVNLAVAEDAETTKVIIRKYEKNNYSKLLGGAKLKLFSVTNDAEKKETLVPGGEFESDAKGKEFDLKAGHYILKEESAPAGYKKAKSITFDVVGGKVHIRGKEVVKESKDPYSIEAYRNTASFTKLGSANYNLDLFVGKGDTSEVVYCFNADKNQPIESEDYGKNINYEDEGETQFGYTRYNSKADLSKHTEGHKGIELDKFNTKIRRVLFAGYPSLAAGIEFNSKEDMAKRAATQLAIYYYTDNADIQGLLDKTNKKVFHGFENYGDDVLKDALKIIAFADGSDKETEANVYDFNFYVPSKNKYQALLGASKTKNKTDLPKNPGDMIYSIQMEDEVGKDPDNTTVLVSKQNLAGEEIAGAKIKILKKDNGELATDYTDPTGNTKAEWTSEKDKTKSVKLEAGEYKLVEDTSPVGYKKITTINFKVKADGSLEVTNSDELANNKDKINIETGENNKKNKLVVTDNIADGEIKTTVKVGEKQASQKKAVELTKEEVKNKVKVVDVVTYKNLQAGETYKLTGSLMEIVEGKELQLIKEVSKGNLLVDDKGSGEWTIEFEDVKLETGKKYVVYETATSQKKLAIGENGVAKQNVISHKNKDDLAQTIIVEKQAGPVIPDNPTPKPETTSLKFSKQDIAGKELKGAKIILLGNNGDKQEWISDGSVHEFTVKEGKYTFHEEKTPDNSKYKIATDITFEVVKNKKTNALEIKNIVVGAGNKLAKDGTLIMVDDYIKDSSNTDNKPNSNKSSNGKKLAKTGDLLNPIVLATGILALGFGISLAAYQRKKKND